jgi:pimeloyl-ACP methyl ester carboxylesterase
VLLAFVVLVTLASFSSNGVTDGRERQASALYQGPFVEVGGTSVAYRTLTDLPAVTVPSLVVWGADDTVDPIAAGPTHCSRAASPVRRRSCGWSPVDAVDPASVAEAIQHMAR